MAALICVDGLLPLGPDLPQQAPSLLGGTGAADWRRARRSSASSSLIPGGGTAEQLGLIQKSIGSVSDWMDDFTSSTT